MKQISNSKYGKGLGIKTKNQRVKEVTPVELRVKNGRGTERRKVSPFLKGRAIRKDGHKMGKDN